MKEKYFNWIRKCCVIILLILFPGLALVAQQNPLEKEAHKTVAFPGPGEFSQTKLSYSITPAPNQTFGYDVFADGKLLIRQNSIPAMPGNNGFKNKATAEKVAQLVILKIQKGEMPPTIAVEELKKLNALNR